MIYFKPPLDNPQFVCYTYLMKSKKTIWYGVRGREIVLPKGSELWPTYHADRRQKGYVYIAYFYKSQDGTPSYSPFISEKQAYQLGVI